MARLATWAALAVAVGVIVGCGPAKELPDEVPDRSEPEYPAETVPSKSDMAAKAYIDKAVIAYTGGNPELVAKGVASRLKLTGSMRDPTGNPPVPVPATRTIAAVWPDRFADVDEREAQGQKITISAYLIRPRLTIMTGNQEAIPPDPAELERNFVADETAQHWMALFLPVTDPNAIVYDLRQQTINSQQVLTVKVALGKLPVYHLTFDAKNDALLRVEYAVTEQGVQRRMQWNMADHKPGPDGLLLPGKMGCRRDNVIVEEWAVEKWEFPAKIDDAEFSPPKQ